MDPITIGTTVASLVATFTKGAQTCNTILSKCKHAPQTLASIYTECTTIKLALSHVYWLVNSNTELLSSQLDAQGPLAETFDVALTGCTVNFSLLDVELQELCQQSKEKETFSAKERIRFVWNEDLARSLLDNMRGLQGAVTLLLTALQTSSLAALNRTIAQQRSVIERVRQSTNSVCEGISQTSQGRNESFDSYSIFSSTIGDEEFAFDNEVINSKVYRRVLNKARKAQVLRDVDPGREPELLDEPLIDLSDEPKIPSVPTLDDSGAGSRWFGSFDGALPAELPGDSAFVGSGDGRAQDQISLGDTTSTQDSGLVPPSDTRSLESRSAEPSARRTRRTEQDKRRGQYFNEDDSEGQGDDHEADNEIEPSKKLAGGGRNQEAQFAVYRQQMMEVNGEQPPDLPNMQMTLQQPIITEKPHPSPYAGVSEPCDLSKATVTTDDTNTSVPGTTAGKHTYETASSSPFIRTTRPLSLDGPAHLSFESLGAVIAPLDRSIYRHRSDASGSESVRDLHTSSLPRRTPSIQTEFRAGTASGLAMSKSSDSLDRIETPDLVGAKEPDEPDGYTDKSPGRVFGAVARISSNDRLQTDADPDPLPPTINMHSVPLAEIKRSGSESHSFILSALVWLVEPDSYTIKDSFVSNSIPEIRIIFLGTICGKTSAYKTYAAQNPEFMALTALTVLFDSYKIRVPVIINRSGFTQESIVTLIDAGSNGSAGDTPAHKFWNFSPGADVVVLCYPVEGVENKWIKDVTYHWLPQIDYHYHKVPVILVGMTTDRRDTARSDDLHPASSYDEGLACAKTINAAAYVECSSTSLESINQMFETAIRLAVVSKLKGQQIQSPPLKHRLSNWWKGHKTRPSTSSHRSS